MSPIESPVQEALDRLEAQIRDTRRLILAVNGGHSNPAPVTSGASDAANLLAQEETTDALRRLEQAVEGLPAAFADALADRFDVVEEELEEEPKGKGNAKGKAKEKAKAENDDDEGEPEPPSRRGYFRGPAAE